MHRIRVAAIAALSGMALATPGFAWKTTIAGDGFDVASQVVEDPSGNVITAGRIVRSLQLDFIVAKLDGTTGAILWQTEIDGPAGDEDIAVSVAVDAAGNAIAAGHVFRAVEERNFFVVKLAAADGSEVWRYEIDGTQIPFSYDTAFEVVVDTAGDVIAVGYLTQDGPGSDWYVVKLASADGSVLWDRDDLDDLLLNSDRANAVALDSANNVLVAGSERASGPVQRLSTLKLMGSDGSTAWRRDVDAPLIGQTTLNDVAVDDSDNVVVSGAIERVLDDTDFYVGKYQGSDGAVIWEREIDGGSTGWGDEGYAIGVDPVTDDVVAAGTFQTATPTDYAVMKLAAATGATLWSVSIDGTSTSLEDFDRANSVAVDSLGDVLTTGSINDASNQVVVIRHAAANGATLWRRDLPGGFFPFGESVIVDSAGDVVASGTAGTDMAFTVLKLQGATGDYVGYVDSDGDGLSDDMEDDLGTDPFDPDSDGDGLPDGGDVEFIGDVVAGLPLGSFGSRSDPGGQRSAFLGRLESIEEAIASGDTASALRQLRNLRRRIDGCPPTADSNDWIADCTSQLEIRALVDVLIMNLGG